MDRLPPTSIVAFTPDSTIAEQLAIVLAHTRDKGCNCEPDLEHVEDYHVRIAHDDWCQLIRGAQAPDN
jgi:hypothetical protein